MLKIYAATILIIALFAVNIFLAVKNSQDIPLSDLMPLNISSSRRQAYVFSISEPNYIPILNANIPRPTISGRSALVYDTYSNRFLYEEGIDFKLPIASLTKILSAIIILERLNSDDIVTITENSIKVDGEKQDLYLGEKLTVRNLLKLMLIESSNDAAYALAIHAKNLGINFIGEMNLKAQVLGMRDSIFTDPAGLDDGAYSTAKDLVKLVQYSLSYKEIWDISAEKTAIVESSDERIKHSIISTNQLLGLIKDIIGGKTGYTDGAGQCMILVASVPDYPGKIISIVLGSNDRFGDTQKLVEWTRTAYRWK